MVTSVENALGIIPQQVLADKGYYTPDLIEQVESDHRCRCYVALPEEASKSTDERNGISFIYDQVLDRYVCSQGKPLPRKASNVHKRNSMVNLYHGQFVSRN